MFGINEKIDFVAINIAVMTVSDTRTELEDKSGDTLVDRLQGAGHNLAARAIIKDETDAIVSQLQLWIDDPKIDAVLATGGTGVTGRDVTPEAFQKVFDKEIRVSVNSSECYRTKRLVPQQYSLELPPAWRGHLPICSTWFDRRMQRCLGRYSSIPA